MNRERSRALTADWYAKNKPRIRAWRALNRERHNAYLREFVRRPDQAAKKKARAAAWAKANPELLKTYKHKRRSALRGNGGNGVSPSEWAKILDLFNGKCAYCNSPGTTRDHVMPISRGGIDDPSNVVPACNSCNASKRNKTVSEWMGRR